MNISNLPALNLKYLYEFSLDIAKSAMENLPN